MRPAAAVLAALLLAPRVHAEELPPEKVAKVRHETQKALAEVAKAHGNKPQSELSKEERAEIAHEESAAAQAVLERNGLSSKEFARSDATLSRDETNEVNREVARLQEKDRLDARAAAAKAEQDAAATEAAPEIEYGETEVAEEASVEGDPEAPAGEEAEVGEDEGEMVGGQEIQMPADDASTP